MSHTGETGQKQTSKHRLVTNSSTLQTQLSLHNCIMVDLLGQQNAVLSNCQYMRAPIARTHTEQDWRHHKSGRRHHENC